MTRYLRREIEEKQVYFSLGFEGVQLSRTGRSGCRNLMHRLHCAHSQKERASAGPQLAFYFAPIYSCGESRPPDVVWGSGWGLVPKTPHLSFWWILFNGANLFNTSSCFHWTLASHCKSDCILSVTLIESTEQTIHTLVLIESILWASSSCFFGILLPHSHQSGPLSYLSILEFLWSIAPNPSTSYP